MDGRPNRRNKLPFSNSFSIFLAILTYEGSIILMSHKVFFFDRLDWNRQTLVLF